MDEVSKTLLDLNIVKMDKGKHAALLGEAHEFIATGILMRLGFRVSVVSVRGGPYDLIIPAYENFDAHPEKTVLLRAQTKTMTNALRFIAGTRAGVNRIYISGVKTYKYSEKDNDLIIGLMNVRLTFILCLRATLQNGEILRARQNCTLIRIIGIFSLIGMTRF